MKKILFFSVIVVGLLPLFSCVTDKGTGVTQKEVLVINYRMNTAKADYDANYFKWSFGEDNIEDKYDATSKASVNKTTGKFNSVRFAGRAEDKKMTMPAGLRSVLFYAIADWSLAEVDALKVEEKGGVITVKFVHHGKAYILSTNEKGEFDVLTGSKIAKDFADKGETKHDYKIKPEYLVEGGDPTKMKDLKWDALTMKDDKYTSDAAFHFEGKLKFEFKDNVLSISGELQKV